MREIVWTNRVVVNSVEGTWGELRECSELQKIQDRIQSGTPTAFCVRSGAEAISILLAAITCSNSDVLLVPEDKVTDLVEERILRSGFKLALADGTIIRDPSAACNSVPGRITLLTSGSTGAPKLVSHNLDSLFTASRSRRAIARTWLVPYQTASYAWFQLITLGLFCKDQVLVIAESEDLADLFAKAAENHVDSISATPTFWRLALLTLPESALRRLDLKTITLGGELVDQGILNDLAALFPSAEITHIYASTEVGACIVVSDKQAGFPESYLQREGADVSLLKIVDGVLWVKSPNAARSSLSSSTDGWINTGDRVEVRTSRVHFCGRADLALINVGGNKAFPADIERVILEHPAIRWCRVRATRAPLMGCLPEADVVVKKNVSPPDEAALTNHCSSKLPNYAIPRFWNFLDSIPIQSSLKSAL